MEGNSWLALITVIVGGLMGAGGITAFFKQRSDSKEGVQRENRSDSDSLNVRAVAMIETQFNYLVKPLQDRVAAQDIELGAVKTKLSGVYEEVEGLKNDVARHRSLYLIAVEHIQRLYDWIAHHMPPDAQQDKGIPKPPIALAEDIDR